MQLSLGAHYEQFVSNAVSSLYFSRTVLYYRSQRLLK